MKYFVDTNIFLRTIAKENKATASECHRLLKLIKQGKLKAVTSSVILAEINWTLTSFYRLSKKETVLVLKGILALKNLTIKDRYDIIKTMELYAQKNIKFIDCLIASQLAREKNAVIISYDSDFDKIKNIARKEPKEILAKFQ